MQFVRMIYVSESRLLPTSGSLWSQVNEILSVSQKTNERVGVTGALLFNEDWFVQVVEGRLTPVWELFDRLRRDERHRNLRLVEIKGVHSRLFENWWMGCSQLTEKNADVYKPYLIEGRFLPVYLSGEMLLSLVTDLGRRGFHNAAPA